jgi:hypothetical protein
MNQKNQVEIFRPLKEAYLGYYEDEMAADLTALMEEPEHAEAWVLKKISSDTTKERLRVYLEWNGILGYSEVIYAVAMGKLLED